MNKIIIHGFYGHGNLGDEAILESLLKEFGKFPELEITVFSSRPQEVSRMYQVRSINSIRKKTILRRIYEIKKSKLFILGGGGLLRDTGGNSVNIKNWLKPLILAQRLGTKTVLCGIGVENIRYPKSKKIICKVLNKTNLITVRDENSKKTLQQMGITNEIKVTADPAILLNNNLSKIKWPNSSPKIMICVRHWFDKGFYIENQKANKNFINSLSIAADFLIEHYNATVDFIPMRTITDDDDGIVARQILSQMKYKNKTWVCSVVPKPREFIEMLKKYSLIIGMRLHSLILATSAGIPVIGFEYMPKVKAYMASISQGEYSLSMTTINSDKLIQLTKNTFEHYDFRAQTIISKISELQSMARNTLKEIVTLARNK